jgi:hypothetical protein
VPAFGNLPGGECGMKGGEYIMAAKKKAAAKKTAKKTAKKK